MFLLFFIGGWLLLLAGICGYVWRHRSTADQVSPQWLHSRRYKRTGDIPPGTSRQEEGR